MASSPITVVDLSQLSQMYAESGLKNPAVIIDTNHSNSGKKWMEQARIAKDILHSTRHSADICQLVKGLMIESYIERRLPEGGRGRVREVHHRPVPRLGKDRAAGDGDQAYPCAERAEKSFKISVFHLQTGILVL